MRRVSLLFALASLNATLAQPAAPAGLPTGEDFTVMAYNVEMLFDVDGVSLIDDYQPAQWHAAHLDRKLTAIFRVLQRVNDGRGPEIICFNEFEADQTPQSTVTDLPAFLEKWKNHHTSDLLNRSRHDAELAGWPVQAWLAKRLADDGLDGYHVVVGEWRDDPSGRTVFHTNAVFSRFPITASRTHHTIGARGILEVQVDVVGHPLHLFNNHWKSGASDPETEPIRIANATVLRQRLDEILRADPLADVILAGDFNSQYNQKQRYPQMRRTAINEVLGSQGDEAAVATLRGPALYNLWFELPIEQRGSDEYRGEWGTLMQILVTRGLYDPRGVHYIDNSFGVAAFPGLNADAATGRPLRWTSAGDGDGVSDHLPIFARFRAGSDGLPIRLVNPNRTRTGPATAVRVALALDRAIDLNAWPRHREPRTAENVGKLFRARGRVTRGGPLMMRIEGPGIEIAVWIHDRAKRDAFIARHKEGDTVTFVGELGQYRGEWQLVIPASTLP